MTLHQTSFYHPIIILFINDEKFKKIFKKLSQTQNLDTLSIFIDNKNLLNKNEENPLISIISEFKISDTYNLIGDYLKKNLNIFDTILNKKIDNKLKIRRK